MMNSWQHRLNILYTLDCNRHVNVPESTLTNLQSQVIMLIQNGLHVAEIASVLALPVSTVRCILYDLYKTPPAYQ